MADLPRNRIAEARKARGMTQQQLADAVGSHWITISKLERGRIKLTTDWLERLAKPLGVSPRDLLVGTTGKPTYGWAFGEPTGLFSRFEESGSPYEPIRLRIDGPAYEPFLHEGDTVSLVPLRNIDQKRRKELEGRLCFCDFGTKASRPGFLYSGKKPNTYDLFWLSRRVAVGVREAKIHLVTGISFNLMPP
jgi:transcriptional regulator with XRE-family HTH domain